MNTKQQSKEFTEWLETVKYDNSDILSPSGLAWNAWQAALQKLQEEYCPLSDPNHPHGIRFREDSPTTNARWERLCCSGQSWYQIAEEMKLDCRQSERELTTAQNKIQTLSEIGIDQMDKESSLKSELKTVTEQRDRLAEALRKIKNACATYNDPYDELDFIDGITYEALQSLNQPTEP